MFEKSLIDLIRGLRHFKGAESDYVESCLQECRKEVRDSNSGIKANALLKLVYLEMFGHDMAWAAFNVLEVMSSTTLSDKRIGYLAAVQTFRPRTDVLLMMTNMLKKDLNSPFVDSIMLPLMVLPHVANSSLASAVVGDVLSRLSHSNHDICKKAVASLFSLTMAQSDLLQISWPSTIEMLLENSVSRSNRSISAALTNVICELALRRPQDCLILAPRLFDLLVEGENNWMLIKIIKTFAKLTETEPRLAGKLLPPLINLVHTSPAMSVLYECINAILQDNILATYDSNQVADVINLCVEKLVAMITTTQDPNLRFVALGTLNNILWTHPAFVKPHNNAIVQCIQDTDHSIKAQVLGLLPKLVESANLHNITTQLLHQLHSQDEDKTGNRLKSELESGKLAVTIAHTIIDCCRLDDYSHIGDFEWYTGVLVQLLQMCLHQAEDMSQSADLRPDLQALGTRLTSEISVLAARLTGLRATIVSKSCVILHDIGERSINRPSNTGDIVISSLVRIIGEYSSSIVAPHQELDMLLRLGCGLAPRLLISLIVSISRIGFELMLKDLQDGQWSSMTSQLLGARISEFLSGLVSNENIEVQERASGLLEVYRLINESMSDASHYPPLSAGFIDAMSSLFGPQALNAVAAGAQDRIPDIDSPLLQGIFNDGIASILPSVRRNSKQSSSLGLADNFYNVEQDIQDIYSADSAIPTTDLMEHVTVGGIAYSLPPLEAIKVLEQEPIHSSSPHLARSELGSGANSENPAFAHQSPADITSRPSHPSKGDWRPHQYASTSKETKYVLAPLDDVATLPEKKIRSPHDGPSPSRQAGQTGTKLQALTSRSLEMPEGQQVAVSKPEYLEQQTSLDSTEMVDALTLVNNKRLEMQRDADRINVRTEDGYEAIRIIKKPKAKKRNIAKP